MRELPAAAGKVPGYRLKAPQGVCALMVQAETAVPHHLRELQIRMACQDQIMAVVAGAVPATSALMAERARKASSS